ncbi:MAG: hypothetical protein AUK55_00745 [Syntrophobacteraceae bacterium CG2_30_61_12]|nr:MAG: hypothetical protein AUK55_00745 [Syntrophobacteraceae bacterium CG2_30_61_12]PIU32530.1 MAG: hypothetical protein COT06_02270 [Syntrophobacteraceae bacterium CG07_land_8_20_14_0_80_61_8]
MKALSIRYKINAAIFISGLLTALVCNLILLPFQLRDRNSQWEGIQLLLQSVMEQKRDGLANEIFAGQERALAASLRELKKIEGIAGVRLYDPDASEIQIDPEMGLRRVAPLGERMSLPQRPVFREETIDGRSFAVYWTPIETLGQRVAYARVLYDLSAFSQQRRLNLILALAVSAAIMLVLAAILNPLLSRLVIGPVMSLRTAMQQVQSGNLGHQVRVHGPDEIGEVAATFNEMSRELEQQQLALENWSSNLEQVVKERTRSLQVLSDQLQAENQERREIQEALEQSEAKLRGIVRVAPIGIGLVTHGVLTQVNETLCRLLGFPEEQLLGKDLADFFADRSEWTAVFPDPEGLNGNENGAVATLRSRDGSLISAFLCATALDPARPEEGTAFIAMDVTEPRRAEQALRESEERLRAIFNNAGIGIMVTDRHGRYLQANAAWAEMLGYSPAFLVELEETELILPEDVEAGARRRAEIISGRRDHYRYELRYRRRDGATIRGDVTATPIRDPDGQVQEVIQTVLDITEKKRFEQEMIRSEKLESIAGLAGGIAHDFNNVLTAIVGNIGLARMTLDQREKVSARLEAAEKACLRAQELAKKLLTFSRGGAPIKQACSVAEIVRDAAGLCLTGANVAGSYDLPADLWAIEADRDQVHQVVSNLVMNAVQAMPTGGTIGVSAANLELEEGSGLPLPAGRYVEVAVTDQGPGIEPERLVKIFDPFLSTKKDGSGLGLATAHSIVRRHKGHISVESELGVGTTFRILLPAWTAHRTAAAAPGVDQDTANGQRVLIMDDEEIILDISSEILRHLGYRVATARDGAEAIRQYREALAQGTPFAAVIMDLTIPGGMGGKEAIGEIRRLDPAARAVVSSGYSNDPVMADFRDHGFDAVAVKPYKIVELKRLLSELLAPPRD